MRGREVGETGQRNKDWRRKYGTGSELRCANWVEAVGVDSVELQEGCVEDERRVRDVMESRRRRKWKCMLKGVVKTGVVKLCRRVGVSRNREGVAA